MCMIIITFEVLQPWYVWYVRVRIVPEGQTKHRDFGDTERKLLEIADEKLNAA